MKLIKSIFGDGALAKAQTAIQDLNTKLVNLGTEAKEAATKFQATIDDLQAKLTAANARIAELEGTATAATTEADKAKADAATATAEATAKAEAAEEKSKKIDDLASQQALEITAGQAAVPVAAEPGAGGGEASVMEQLAQIKDPKQRATFIKKNKAALDKAMRAGSGAAAKVAKK